MVDVTKKDNMDIVYRLIYNVFKLFSRKDTTFTLITYGAEVNTVFDSKVFGSSQEIQEAMKQVRVQLKLGGG